MKDPQGAAVYAWEDEWVDWNRPTLSLTEVREYVHEACRVFGVEAPVVKQHDGPAMSFSLTARLSEDSVQAVVDFRIDHKNPAIALHEAAHHICTVRHPRVTQDHGPTWLGIYMALLMLAKVAPKEALYATARKHKLRWKLPTIV